MAGYAALLPPYELAYHGEKNDETSTDNCARSRSLHAAVFGAAAGHGALSGTWPRAVDAGVEWIWRGHYRAAVKGGLDPKVGADLAAGKRPEGMKEDEAILYELATQIYRDKTVSDAAYEAALAKFGERGIVELLGLMGYYDLVAKMLITANAVPPKEVDVPQLQPLAK